MSVENINATNETMYTGEGLPREQAQQIGHETLEAVQETRLRDELMAGILGTPVEGFGSEGRRTFYRMAAGNEISYDDVNLFFSNVERPDQAYLRKNPSASVQQAYGETINALGGDMMKLLILDSVAYGGKSKNEEIAVSSFTVGSVLEEFPTVYDFDHAKGEELEKQVGSTMLSEFERALYGDEQVKYKDVLYRIANDVLRYRESAGQITEVENSGEKLVSDSSLRMLSKAQVASVRYMSEMIMSGKEDGSSQDAAYVDNERGLFAVFDGVGGDNGSEEASRACARALPGIFDKNDFASEQGKRDVLSDLAAVVNKGSTTGVIANVARDADGGKVLHFAAVGDSRLYVVHADGTSEQISHDDNVTDAMIIRTWYFGNRVRYEADKAGSRKDEIENLLQHGISNSLQRGYRAPAANNIGSYRLAEGDQLVLCSDGITGDTGDDIRSESDVAAAVCGRSADEATKNLFNFASKYDDRTAIVVNI
ncbi:protein phosphatase 2C domain-containing protein [Candidatus Saccharibacteria bacterium]|nr:protein phosphatase 2C domain-containing protein [Candidatus Saccharibacteria bacterium]